MSLERFRDVTLSGSRASAEQALRESRAAADEKRASCDADAEHLVAQARDDGRDAASRELVAEERLTRRRARETVLAARRALYEKARREAIEWLRARHGSAEYEQLIASLRAQATEQLGAGVRCSEAPDEVGGVIAEVGGRRVIYSLEALVDDELRRRRTQVEHLWT